MILESRFWKDDLIKQAASIRRRLRMKRWTEASHARLEQAIMLGFYSIRKLIEAEKLPPHIAEQDVTVTIYPAVGKTVHKMNWWYFWELYDMEKPEPATKSLMFLCHQFVHSYVFHLDGDDADPNLITGFFVSSDRERNKRLYRIDAETLAGLFEQVGNDTACYAFRGLPETRTFDDKRGDYVITWGTPAKTPGAPPPVLELEAGAGAGKS